MIGISVIICCYNSEKRLPETISHLLGQTHLNFEIIIVDNASKDSTFETAENLLKVQDKISFRIIREEQAGLSHARKAGRIAATHEIILFCDDDNWLDLDYLKNLSELFTKNPEFEMIGGLGEPEFELTHPLWFEKYQTNFACGALASGLTDKLNEVTELYGAGIAIKKSFFEKLDQVGFESILSDRKGNDLMSGGDTEYCIVARMMGLKLGYHPALTFKHYMPDNRMNIEYLKKLHKGFGKSRLFTQVYQYVIEHDAIPNLKIKLPFWKDKLIYKKRELRKFYPKIWFVNQTKMGNLDYVLKFEALKGEMEMIEQLADDYLKIYEKVLALKKKIEIR